MKFKKRELKEFNIKEYSVNLCEDYLFTSLQKNEENLFFQGILSTAQYVDVEYQTEVFVCEFLDNDRFLACIGIVSSTYDEKDKRVVDCIAIDNKEFYLEFQREFSTKVRSIASREQRVVGLKDKPIFVFLDYDVLAHTVCTQLFVIMKEKALIDGSLNKKIEKSHDALEKGKLKSKI